jgi:nucleoside-diphosphate-sugar epimerase
MKALVTGGCGFIGSNLVKLLLNKQWEVRIIDNLDSGNILNISGLNVDFLHGDICSDQDMFRACNNIDVVFHLAASVGRQKSLDNPTLDSNVNLIGTLCLLENMRKNKVDKIVYSSSAAIFGELISNSIDETHQIKPDSPYGVSKLAAEKMILAYSQIYQIKAVCLRYFNIYGLNQRYDYYGNVIPIFAYQLLNDLPITIYGDGNQTRDFLNVCDVANANYLAATNDQPSDVYNLGSGHSISINELVIILQNISGKNAIIEYLPKRHADVMHCKAKVNKIKDELGFYPKINLEDGLKDYLNWCASNLYNNNIIK